MGSVNLMRHVFSTKYMPTGLLPFCNSTEPPKLKPVRQKTPPKALKASSRRDGLCLTRFAEWRFCFLSPVNVSHAGILISFDPCKFLCGSGHYSAVGVACTFACRNWQEKGACFFVFCFYAHFRGVIWLRSICCNATNTLPVAVAAF